MDRAIMLARAVEGATSPNPPVGAVLVREDLVVGEGATQPPGGKHAEIVALLAAGKDARGATLYVTLEPCAHHGRTPPCAPAVVEAGIAAAHIGVVDPNPRVNGQGISILEQAGITVYLGEGENLARELIAGHTALVTLGRPLVTAVIVSDRGSPVRLTSQNDAVWVDRRRVSRMGRWGSDIVVDGEYNEVLQHLGQCGIARLAVTDPNVVDALLTAGQVDRVIVPTTAGPAPPFTRLLDGDSAEWATYERPERE